MFDSSGGGRVWQWTRTPKRSSNSAISESSSSKIAVQVWRRRSRRWRRGADTRKGAAEPLFRLRATRQASPLVSPVLRRGDVETPPPRVQCPVRHLNSTPKSSGTGAKGNDGVAACIKQNDNSIGYVEQAYALANNFTYASVKNKAGNFVEPTLEAASAAGTGVKLARRPALLDDQRPGRPGLPDHRASRSCSSTRTCARRAWTRTRPSASRPGWTTRSATARASPRSSSTRRSRTQIKSAAKAKVDGLVCNGSADRGLADRRLMEAGTFTARRPLVLRAVAAVPPSRPGPAVGPVRRSRSASCC